MHTRPQRLGQAVATATILVVILAALSRTQVLAQAPPASVTGRVLDGSRDNAPAAGIVVSLVQLEGATKRSTGTTVTDANGAFGFDGLETGETLGYVVSVSFADTTYSSAVVRPQPGGSSNANINVYATTAADAAIQLDRVSIVLASVDSRAGVLSFVESHHVRNVGAAALIGGTGAGERRTLQVPLFAGARNLNPIEGFRVEDVAVVPGGFALTTPVLPGPSVVSFTYDIPYSSHSVSLTRKLVYPTAVAEVVLPDDVRITSPQLDVRATVQLGSRSFDTIQGHGLTPGGPFQVQLNGLPLRPTPLLDLGSVTVQVAVVGLIIAAAATLVAAARQRRYGSQATESDDEQPALLLRIAELDERAERGLLVKDDYTAQRAIAMERLITVSTQLRKGSGSQTWPRATASAAPRPRQSGEAG